MMFAIAQGLLLALAAYMAIGIAFGLAFVASGVARIDASAQGMTLAARLLLLPGAAALWPFLLMKWLRQQPPPAT